MEEVAMRLEKWSEVEKGRRGWGREEFHASETTDVQGRRRGAGTAGGSGSSRVWTGPPACTGGCCVAPAVWSAGQ